MNSLDDLELELRKLPGVKAAGFDERDDMLLVQLHVGDKVDSPEHPVPIDASRIVARHIDERTAVEIVRWRSIPASAEPAAPVADVVHPGRAGRAERRARRPRREPRRGHLARAPGPPPRRARVPRHRRARSAPDPRRPAHDRPRGFEQRARGRGRSHARRGARARRARSSRPRCSHARSRATPTSGRS